MKENNNNVKEEAGMQKRPLVIDEGKEQRKAEAEDKARALVIQKQTRDNLLFG